ncbi:hypothetical protein BC834DRAFT_281687 [Gloeopeniophorella convolvens]|nr:hypothetical protein BC834DRAFT_281687 [Gloeopeniophorella convolvens]
MMRSIMINTLPDDALLEVFDWFRIFRLKESKRVEPYQWEQRWYTLAHVCHRWRQVIFASPRRLGLRYYVSHGSPVSEILRHSHQFPLILDYSYRTDDGDDPRWLWPSESVDDITLALAHLDRIKHITLEVGSVRQLHHILNMTAGPAQQLEVLSIESTCGPIWFPGTILSGHAPALLNLKLSGVITPLPLSPCLISLDLMMIGIDYMDALIFSNFFESVRAMSQLRDLSLMFREDEAYMVNEDCLIPPSGTRASLSSLHEVNFSGPTILLEALASRIDAPNLSKVWLQFYRACEHVLVPSLSRFICNIFSPPFPTDLKLCLSRNNAYIQAGPGLTCYWDCCHGWEDHSDALTVPVSVLCRSLVQVLSLVTSLRIADYGTPRWTPEDGTHWADDEVEWRDILVSFPGVVELQLDDGFKPTVAKALQEPDGRVLLPKLQKVQLFKWDEENRQQTPAYSIPTDEFLSTFSSEDLPTAP